MKQKQLFELTRVDWETPQALFDELDAEFGFTLDVCASAENAKCERFYTVKQDGLKQDWRGQMCWMNPPYGREIAGWVEKAHAESLKLDTYVVGLLPARTDTAWWHDHILAAHAEMRFIRGRIQFGSSRQNAPFPSAIVVWR